MIIGFDGSRSFVKNKTGTENYAYQLLKHLAQIDDKNQYIIYLRPGNEVEEWSPFTEKSQDARRSTLAANCGWPSNFQFKLLNYRRLWTQVGLAKQTFIDNLDVLFVPSHTLPLIRKPNLKTVMTVHDLGAEYLPGMHQLKQRLYLSLMTKIQLKTATKLIAVSEATKKDLIRKVGINNDHIKVIYEGVTVNSNEKKDRDIRSDKHKFDSSLINNVIDSKIKDIDRQDQIIINSKSIYKNRYFLFVGTIQPRKNLIRLIKAYAGLVNIITTTNRQSPNLSRESLTKLERENLSGGNNTPNRSLLKSRMTCVVPKLVLAGGKGWLSDEIYTLPKKLGIDDNVIFTGRVSDEELVLLYENALAFTFPSLFEGFGLPILEAFEAKVPVITANSSSLPEVAGEAALLIDPNNTEQLLDALIKIYDDPLLRNSLVKKGTEQLKKFSWQKCAEQTLAVLESVKSYN